MRRPEFLARQARRPSGILGRLLGRVMALETAAENAVALELLELQPTDHVLEIGFGPGATVGRAAAETPDGFVAGVDASETMVRLAASRNRRLIAGGGMELKIADSAALPYGDARFDKAYAVHVLYFWKDPLAHLREARRVLRPGGRFVLGFRSDPAAVRDFPSPIYRFYSPEEAERLLEQSGFRQMRSVVRGLAGRRLVWVIGRAPDPAPH